VGVQEVVLLKLSSVPDVGRRQLDNVLAAVAAAWALGVSADLIRAGIATFEAERADGLVR
jgi:cyanophycin synthetase